MFEGLKERISLELFLESSIVKIYIHVFLEDKWLVFSWYSYGETILLRKLNVY